MGNICNTCPDPPGASNLCYVLLHKMLLQREEEEKEEESDEPERTKWYQYNSSGE